MRLLILAGLVYFIFRSLKSWMRSSTPSSTPMSAGPAGEIDDIMVKDPVTISPELPVEEAISLGKKHGIGAFPVIEKKNLVGIITESDITDVVSNALGLGDSDSKRITIYASGKRFGYLKDLIEVLDKHHIPLLSIMSIPKSAKGDWFLVLRLKTKDAGLAAEDLKKKGFNVTNVT